jgi:hypothetical protein
VPLLPSVTLPKLILLGVTESCTEDATVKVRVALPVPLLLVALNVTLDVPAEVGVPEIRPVPVLTDKPAGNPAAP